MADLPNLPIEDVDDAQPNYVPLKTDKVLLILTDKDGNETGVSVLTTLAVLAQTILPAQTGGSTAQPPKIVLELSTPTTTTGKTVVLTAKVTPGTAAVKQVEFFDGGDRIGSALTSSPYQYAYLVQTTGKHALVAKVTDADGNSVVSDPQYLTVNASGAAQPVVTLNQLSPSSAPLGTSYTLVASASVSGSSIAKVEFFDGANSIGTDASSPYAVSYTPGSLGQHVFSAKATDLNGNSAISTTQTITITQPAAGPNQLPTVSLTLSPASITAGQSTTINAPASDTDGTITKVELFDSANLLTTLTTPPYSFVYTPTGAAGGRTIRADATDNQGGKASTTATLSISAGTLPTPPAPEFTGYNTSARTATVAPPTGYAIGDLAYVLRGASPVAVPSTGVINVGPTAVRFGELKVYVVASSSRNKGDEALNEVEYTAAAQSFTLSLDPGAGDRTMTNSAQSQGSIGYNETNANGSNAIVAVAPNPTVATMSVFFPNLQTQIGQFNFDPGNLGHECEWVLGGTHYQGDSASGSRLPLTFTDGSVLLSV